MQSLAAIGQIIKRDGRVAPFEREKIVEAIDKAILAVRGGDRALAEALADRVVEALGREPGAAEPGVEAIQDVIERVLIEHGHARTAKAFILYRARRSRIREGKSELMEAVADIVQGEGAGEAREVSPATKLATIGMAASRAFYLDRALSEELADAHLRGDLHVHGLAHYDQSPHAWVLPLADACAGGLPSGHGRLAFNGRIASAAVQAGLAIAAAQAECHGGVAVVDFDAALARGLSAPIEAGEVESALEALIWQLNASPVRVAGRLGAISLTIGRASDPLARQIAASLLRAIDRGLGRGEEALRPHVVFAIQAGVNRDAGDPNYDLTCLAAEVASRRLALTFAFEPGEAAYVGHEARLAAPTPGGPGLIARASLNLPRLALAARQDRRPFDELVAEAMALAARALCHRRAALGRRLAGEFPFWHALRASSADADPHAPIAAAIARVPVAIGLVGLAQTLVVLRGEHHGASEASQAEGLALMEALDTHRAQLSSNLGLPIVLQACESQTTAVRFARLDRRAHGAIRNVTDVGAYAGGVALPLIAGECAPEAARREGAYAPWLSGGLVHRRVLQSAPTPHAILEGLLAAEAAGHRAVAFEFPWCLCPTCGHSQSPAGDCARCQGPAGSLRPLSRRGGFVALD